MQNNNKEDFSALSEKYKKELMEYYRQYRPAVVPRKEVQASATSTSRTESDSQNKEPEKLADDTETENIDFVDTAEASSVFSDNADSEREMREIKDSDQTISPVDEEGRVLKQQEKEMDMNATAVFLESSQKAADAEAAITEIQQKERDAYEMPDAVNESGQPIFSGEENGPVNYIDSSEPGMRENLDDIDMDIVPIQPAQTPDGTMSTAYRYNAEEENFDTFTGEGYLSVQVVTANGALPVRDAVVTIKKVENGKTVYEKTLLTNESGNTETVTLPTPKKSLSENPDFTDIPYADYQVQVTAGSYMTVMIEKVPVFSGILSIQPVSLIPGIGTMMNGNGEVR